MRDPRHEPLRVLFVCPYPPGHAVSRYRAEHFAEALGHAGIAAEVAWTGQPRIRICHDVVVLHRIGVEGIGRRLRDAARQTGARLIWATDDLNFDPECATFMGLLYPDEPARYRQCRAEVEAQAAMARAADAVVVSTEFLAERARRITEHPVYVARNFLSEEMLRRSDAAAAAPAADRGGRVLLGYSSGTATHDADLGDIADPLREALRRHPDANLLLIGAVRPPAGFERFAARIHRHPFVDWRDLPGLLTRLDVNLLPLDPTRPFNHGKSEIKWLEAAAVRVPTLAGAAAGVAEALRHGKNALLARTRADWKTMLDCLITRPEARAELAAGAHAALLADSTSAAVSPALAAIFTEIAGDRRARTEAVVRRPFSLAGAVFAAEARLWQFGARMERHRRRMAAEQRTGAGWGE